MRILFVEWKSLCQKDMAEEFTRRGWTVDYYQFPRDKENTRLNKELAEQLLRAMAGKNYDFVFSFNYFPIMSDCCKELNLRYVSWVYDNPYIHVYSYTVLNSCNYIFLFDYSMYQELKEAGIPTVYYLPMAVNKKRLSTIKNTEEKKRRYSCDVSFVGSLYTESKHRLYDKFQNMAPFAKGYIDAVIQAQLKVYGYNFLQEMLTPEILEEMENAYPASNPNASTVMSSAAIYADYVLARQVTSLERRQILERLGSSYEVHLYTNDKSVKIPRVKNKGLVDYYNEMPFVFQNSKINLNITLRSIKTGIPLRAMDIMGCGGFLLSNYQEELLEYFIPNEDFVFYTDYEDLQEKVDFYLSHENERQKIAENGRQKVYTKHTIRQRVEVIFSVLEKSREVRK